MGLCLPLHSLGKHCAVLLMAVMQRWLEGHVTLAHGRTVQVLLKQYSPLLQAASSMHGVDTAGSMGIQASKRQAYFVVGDRHEEMGRLLCPMAMHVCSSVKMVARSNSPSAPGRHSGV